MLLSLALIIPVVFAFLLLPSLLHLITLISKIVGVAETERVICPMVQMKVLLITPGCSWKYGDNVIIPSIFFQCISIFSCLSLPYSFAQNVAQS